MASRVEITSRYAKAYRKAGKAEKGRVLDEVVSVTGWSRDNARRRLVAAARRPGPGRQVAKRVRKQRSGKFSYDAIKVLQRVWAASGGQCGKYLAVSMRTQLDGLERHGELVFGTGRYSPVVRAELLAMSAASIDRYLAPAKATDQIRGVATTKPSPLLRASITIRKAGDEVEAEPGFFEGDTVAHCGPALKGEFARTVNLTDVHLGWVFTRSVRNNAQVHVLSALKAGVTVIPFEVTGLDFDNGSEFLNHDVITWAAQMEIFFTRSRPYKKNDQATIESKNNHLVRKYGFYYRYDTPEELRVLNRLWPLVNDQMNYLTPTKKPAGWGQSRNGRSKRLYDAPATPLDRLLAARVLSPAQEAELVAYRDSLNPAARNEPWACRCTTCGSQVGPRLSSIRNGQGGCRVCGSRSRPRLDPEAAAAEVRAAGFEPLQAYPGRVRDRWQCRCHTCGSEVQVRLGDLRAGHGCRQCWARSQRTTPETAVAVMQAAGLEPLEPFPGTNARWWCRCLTCGKDSMQRLKSVKKGGSRCRTCVAVT